MNPALRTSASGMRAQQLRVDVIAHNLANVNTSGFKRGRVTFEDVFYETLQGARVVNYAQAGTLAPIQLGHGVRLAAIQRIHTQGHVEMTGQPLDLAIEGEGFFQVLRPDGTLGYTRDGTFTISDTGALVTNGGHLLQPPINVPPDATSVATAPSGVLTAQVANGSTPIELGRIELARFVNPSGLESLGENLFGETAASGEPIPGVPQEDGFGRLMGGALEGSNVEIVQEMVDMIAAQRAYEINARAIRTAEEMIEAVNGLMR